MIRPIGFSEPLQRALMGAGDVANTINQSKQIQNQTRELDARLPSMEAEAGRAKLGFVQASRKDALERAVAGIQPGDESEAKFKLMAELTGTTPEMARARYGADLTKAKNESTLSNQDVEKGSIGIGQAKEDLDFSRKAHPLRLEDYRLQNNSTSLGNAGKAIENDINTKTAPSKIEDAGLQPEKTSAQINSLNADAAAAANKPSNLPLDVKEEVTALSTKTGGKVSIANQLDDYLKQFRAAKTEDDKVRMGQQMLKVANSTEGTDAMGAEEVKRLGNALEYHTGNIKAGIGVAPGKFIGRDLPGFETQIESTIKALRGSVNSNRKEADRLLGRQAPAAADTSASAAPAAPGAAQQVTTDAEYDALPSGAIFIGGDGKKRRKP